MEAPEIYRNTIERLRRGIELHTTPSGRASMKAFADAYGFDRSNLVHVLGGKQELSVDLFMRLTAALKKQEPPQLPPGVERWSLRTWLEMQHVDVHGAMYDVVLNDGS